MAKSPLFDIFHVSAQTTNYTVAAERQLRLLGDFRGCCTYNRLSAHLDCGKNYEIRGWMQSWCYLEPIRNKILNEEFQCKGETLKNGNG